MAVLRARARTDPALEVVEGTATFANPSGRVRRDVWEGLRDEVLGQLRAALPVDGIVLGMHGAMVAYGYDDCEGDLLARCRELAGPSCIISAEFDPHCHMSDLRLCSADLMICFKEYSHVDFTERAVELVDLTIRAIRGEITPTMAKWDCRMIDRYPTYREPMRAFTDKLMGLEARSKLSSFSTLAPNRPVSERFPLTPLRNCLFTPELQWQSRGQRRT
jgi:microcystin degradation protein MlrC